LGAIEDVEGDRITDLKNAMKKNKSFNYLKISEE
jgi:hypothetical protein